MKWFTADPHFGHEKMLRPGFASIKDWDRFVIDVFKSQVKKSDTVFILGDFVCGAKPQKYKQQLCGDIWLIQGNHDPSLSACEAVFGKTRVRSTFETHVLEQRTWLSHYAHVYWPASHYGSFHLYGHNHARREETLDALLPERRSMDVGLDNAKRLLGEYCLFSEEFLHEILSKRAGHDPVCFYEEERQSAEQYQRREQLDV